MDERSVMGTVHGGARHHGNTVHDNRSWETITAALDRVCGPGKSSGDWVRYLCPVHEGDGRPHHPSLGVVYNRHKGKTIVRCFAGCADEEVLARLGLHIRDLFDRPSGHEFSSGTNSSRRESTSLPDRAILAAGLPLDRHKSDHGRIVGRARTIATYIYRWPGGRPEGRITRRHTPRERGHDKHFSQERMTEIGWCSGGFAPIPFLLPDVVPAVADGADIYICEGEQDACAGRRAGLLATTNAGGALSWHADHAAWLRGAHRIWIVADRDAPGYRRAVRVAATLRHLVDDIRIVQARDGKDLTDHFNAGHLAEELDPVPLLDDHFRRAATSARQPL